MATQLIDLGNLRFIWKGDWVQENEYELNDTVRYNNIVWIYINPVPASDTLITDTTRWSRMVEGSEIPPTENQAGKVLKTDGTLTFWSDSFDTFSIGQDITDFITAAGLTDVALGIQGSSTSFVQAALVNTGTGTSSSADFIAYASNGTNESGWIDMGITNQSFDDPAFTLTGPGDGYLFMSGAIAGIVEVSQYNVASGTLNIITADPHQMIQGVIFDLVLPAAPALEGRYTVASAPSSTQVAVPVPNGYSGGNVSLTSVINSQINKFTGDGNLVLATDGTGLANNIIIAAGGLVEGNEQIIITPTDGIDITGDVRIAGSTAMTDTVYVGSNAKTFEISADLTNPGAVFELNGEPYAQIAIHNQSSNSSTDIIAYANTGDDASGWIDMGITGSTFSDTTFPITGPHDGYIFMEAPEGTTGEGNLVIATGSNGTDNKIVFAAGGYGSGDTQMTIIPNDRVHIEIPTASVSPTTGALTVVGGVGISGDVNIAGDIVFGGTGTTLSTTTLAVADPIVFVGDGNASDATDLGLVGEYTSSGTKKYSGIVRDASDGIIKLFKDATTKPSGTVNFAGAGLAYASLKLAGLDAATVSTSSTITSTGVINANGGVTTSSGSAVSFPAGITATGGVSLSGTVDVQELRETIVPVTLSTNVGTLDWTAGNIYYIGTAPTGNMTFNLTGVPTDNNKVMTINVFVTQGSTGYIPTTFQIDGTSQTIKWSNAAAPTPTSSAGKIDIFTFSLMRIGSAWVVIANSNLNY
jgi:hypothetical protein